MNKIPMGVLGLRDLHDTINAVVFPKINDEEKVETALTKTEEGYVYEIRYKELKQGWPWRAELPVDPEYIKKLEAGETSANETTSAL